MRHYLPKECVVFKITNVAGRDQQAERRAGENEEDVRWCKLKRTPTLGLVLYLIVTCDANKKWPVPANVAGPTEKSTRGVGMFAISKTLAGGACSGGVWLAPLAPCCGVLSAGSASHNGGVDIA